MRAEARLARGAPDLPARACIQRVDVAVVGADEEPVPRERDAALHLVARLEAPADAARPLVEGVDLAAPVARVDPSVRDERRRLGGADPLRPARLAVPDLKGGDESVEPGAGLVARAAVHEAREDGAPVDVGRGGGAAVRDVHPRAAAGAGAEREEAPGVVRDVEAAVADGGRKLEQAPAARHPEPAEGRAQADVDGDALPLLVAAVRRPRDLPQLGRRARPGLLGGDELDRRGAADVPRLVPLVEHVRGDRAAGEDDQRGEREQDAPHAGRSASSLAARPRTPSLPFTRTRSSV